MRKIGLAVLYWLICVAGTMHAADNGGCKLEIKAEENGALSSDGKPRGPAVLFGESITIPLFRLRFVKARTGQALRPTMVTIAYGWKWLEYPYPEHLWGAWSEASDVVNCTEVANDDIEVLAFEVKPRGWYNGRYARFPFSGSPSFTGIGIAATLPECTPQVTIAPKAARDLGGKITVVKVDCRSESRVTFQKWE